MSSQVEALLSQLTLQEKINLLAGAGTWRTQSIERLGIPALKVSDGPNGLRGEQKDFRAQTSASFPVGTALGATWNPDLVQAVGAALGQEAKAKGAQVLLGPTVNIHRHPLAGRNFECFSEDPLLTAQMAAAYISGLQSQGVGACVKHFACNEQEFERQSISSEVDERALREIYLPPFKAAVTEAQTWTLMSAYNRVNGTYASEHRRLLLDILKNEWGFEGLVISDWYGTYSQNVPAGGLDLEMPGPARWMGPAALAAVQSGVLAEAGLDDKVRRLLRTLERTGLLADPASIEERSIDRPEHRRLIREAGREAIVLLKNESGLLPLDPARIRSLAVIGEPARRVSFQGGGSSAVNPHYVVSPLDAIRTRYGDAVDLAYAPGPPLHRQYPLLDSADLRAEDGTPGRLTVRQYANPALEGEPIRSYLANGSELAWFGEVAADFDPAAFSVRMTGEWTAPVSGTYAFQLAAIGRARLWLDGRERLDGWDQADGTHTTQTLSLDLEAGRPYSLRVEFASLPGEPWRTVRLGCRPPQPEDPIGQAAAAAQAADAALVFVGLTPEWESEGFDRAGLDLPNGQDELIARVAAANPNTIVVINAGSPVHMPWIEAVPGVLQMWYLGQESGNAIVDVLFGEADPGGRLPATFPRRLQDTPAYLHFPGENGRARYAEGLFVGYRYYDKKEVAPLFPFGHGLSYTTFACENLRVTGAPAAGGQIQVQVDVTNTGARAGQEVVQLYLSDMEARLVRPVKELKGFAKVTLRPGEKRTVSFTLQPEALAYYDDAQSRWVTEPGEFEVLIGQSAGRICLAARFNWPPGEGVSA